jgi:hypothetical protein
MTCKAQTEQTIEIKSKALIRFRVAKKAADRKHTIDAECGVRQMLQLACKESTSLQPSFCTNSAN